MSGELGILPNPIPFGKYYLLERVNIGGMAEIFKAKAFGVEGFERLLAVKKILSSIAEDESFINMFIDEAKIAGQLNHPNIAQIFDLGKVDDSYFIALEYISGKDMKTIFERARRLGDKVSLPRVCYILMKVCEGLGHAHHKKDAQGQDLNIVHRDISPQNILVSYEGETKIIDFGIAKAQGKTSQTQVGILKGKFSYMSPEQVRGLHIDRRSDIFSLGIVLYELLTLERLFLGESDFDTLEKIRKVEMSPPSLYNPHIPKELEDIVLKALARSPEDRYQTSYELADALEQFMRNQGHYFTNKDLAAYMKESFSADIEFENKKLEYYRSLNLRPPEEMHTSNGGNAAGSPPAGPMAGLSWGEDELETQIYDRDNGSGPADAPDESIIESIIEADIIYAEDLEEDDDDADGVQGSGTSQQEIDEPPLADDPPTVEYNRDAIAQGLEDLSFEDDSPDRRFGTPGPGDGPPKRPQRKHLPTAQLPSIEPRRDNQNTMPNASAPPGHSSSPDRRSSPAVVLGVSALVVVAGLAILYLLWPWPAEINFTTTPAQVRITLDNEQILDGQTPFTYKVKPGKHTVKIMREGHDEVVIKQEFQKGTTYKINKTLEQLESDHPELRLETVPPDAIVEIEGKTFEGTSPKTIDAFAAGDYEVKVYKTGYAAATKNIELSEGGAEATVELEPITYALALTSDPSRASFELFEDGNDDPIEEGRTPETIKKLEGHKTYRVVLERRGHEKVEETLDPSDETERALKVDLPEEAKSDDDGSSRVAARAPDPPPRRRDPDPDPEPKKDPEPRRATPPKKDPPPKQDPPKQEKPSGTGTLTIASRPAARVHINGKDTGRYTPLLNYKVPAGKQHTIKLVNKEFSLNKTYYVKLKPGESKRIINK